MNCLQGEFHLNPTRAYDPVNQIAPRFNYHKIRIKTKTSNLISIVNIILFNVNWFI